MRELIQGVDAPIYRTASGNPASFDDGAAANVKALSVTLTPTQSGSGNPSSSNVRPISGVSSVSVTRTGKNLFGWSTISGTSMRAWPMKLPPGAYSLGARVTSGDPEKDRSAFLFKSVDNSYTDGVLLRRGTRDAASFTLAKDTVEIVFYASENYAYSAGDSFTWEDIQIESGSVPSDYEPYQGQTVTVSLVDSNNNALTVYGGTLNVTTGELSVTWGNIASYNGETLPGRWISDRDVYAPGAIPTTGAQVVYELAAPVSYSLTGQNLATLSGYNRVTADAGTLAVAYRADPSILLGGAA